MCFFFFFLIRYIIFVVSDTFFQFWILIRKNIFIVNNANNRSPNIKQSKNVCITLFQFVCDYADCCIRHLFEFSFAIVFEMYNYITMDKFVSDENLDVRNIV